jgi:hypothetical protein
MNQIDRPAQYTYVRERKEKSRGDKQKKTAKQQVAVL